MAEGGVPGGDPGGNLQLAGAHVAPGFSVDKMMRHRCTWFLLTGGEEGRELMVPASLCQSRD